MAADDPTVHESTYHQASEVTEEAQSPPRRHGWVWSSAAPEPSHIHPRST